MISLTRLDGVPLVVNVDLIAWIASSPDTVISLTNGEKLIVRETPDDIVARAAAFKRAVTGFSLVANPGDGVSSAESTS